VAAVRWTVGARRDLEEIVQFIAFDSPTYAAATAERIVSAVERLKQHTKLGRTVPEYNDPEIRELLVGNYRVVYRVQRVRVGILAIVHGSRDLLRRAPRERWNLV
jgi:plasmid stabilization system protein ParE